MATSKKSSRQSGSGSRQSGTLRTSSALDTPSGNGVVAVSVSAMLTSKDVNDADKMGWGVVISMSDFSAVLHTDRGCLKRFADDAASVVFAEMYAISSVCDWLIDAGVKCQLVCSDSTKRHITNLKSKQTQAANKTTPPPTKADRSVLAYLKQLKDGFKFLPPSSAPGLLSLSLDEARTATLTWQAPHATQAVHSQHDKLNALQKQAVELFDEGHNIFLTGSAGTGKSFVIETIRRKLLEGPPRNVAFTAWTGIAASEIRGVTLHKLFGRRLLTSLDNFMDWADYTKKQIRELEILVVDEISMVSGEFLDRLDYKVRNIRGIRDKVFGGIQLVFCGDFYQLPPIARTPPRASVKRPNGLAARNTRSKAKTVAFLNRGYAFQSHMWDSADFQVIQLTETKRQTDRRFIDALNAIRTGSIKAGDGHDLLIRSRDPSAANSHLHQEAAEGDVVNGTMHIYKTRRDVSEHNKRRMAELRNQGRHEEVVTAFDSVHPDADMVEDEEEARRILFNSSFFTKSSPVPFALELIEGAMVMLLKNLDLESESPLFNGSFGFIKQIKTLSQISNWPRPIYGEPPHNAEKQHYVLVEFDNGRQELIAPANFSEDVFMLGTCSRKQIPLRLSWAMTIHKAQGLTLPSVDIDFKTDWTIPGMAYVALSRVESLDKLTVRNFNPSQISVSPVVQAFYRQLNATRAIKSAERILKWDEEAGIKPRDKLCAFGYCKA